MKTILTRDVTVNECNWLERNYLKGEILYIFTGCTYGCISQNGTALCLKPDGPFFEIPLNAISPIND